MVAMLLILVTGVAGWSPADRASMEYAALALVMWPSYTGVLFGQTAILAAFLIVLGIFFEIRHGDWQAGISFTLAAAIKPQMAVFFLLVALCRLRWRTWLAATVLGMLLLVVSLSQLYVHHIDWMSSIVESNWVVSRPGGINDPSTLNSENFAILSLTLPLRLLIADNTAVNCLAFFLSAVTGGVAFWLLRKSRDRRSELLRYSIIAVLSLLGVYNRCYDAILLLLPLLWAFMSWRTADRLWAIIAVILTLPFCFVWWMSVLVHMTRAGMISQGAFHSWWWRTFITPHHVYALLLLAVCLCCAAWQNRCPQCQPERQQPSPAAAD
jgi:hypothetical protein